MKNSKKYSIVFFIVSGLTIQNSIFCFNTAQRSEKLRREKEETSNIEPTFMSEFEFEPVINYHSYYYLNNIPRNFIFNKVSSYEKIEKLSNEASKEFSKLELYIGDMIREYGKDYARDLLKIFNNLSIYKIGQQDLSKFDERFKDDARNIFIILAPLMLEFADDAKLIINIFYEDLK